ncbi:hypothetical protein JCM10212_006864 [Sporobolomyces blumeae]
MAETPSPESFRLGRLRLIRLPPTSISLQSDKRTTASNPIEIGVGVTDDYGTDIDLFDSIQLSLEVIDASTSQPCSSLRLVQVGSETKQTSSRCEFAFTPVRGPFHAVSVRVVKRDLKAVVPETIRFRLSVVSDPVDDRPVGPQRIRSVVGEPNQAVLSTWDDKDYVFLGVESGNVELRSGGASDTGAAKKGGYSLFTVSSPVLIHRHSLGVRERVVQTTLRHLELSLAVAEAAEETRITIVERPGLNNSTGQRLWDCAIGLSTYFSLLPDALDPTCNLESLESLDTDAGTEPKAKRRRTTASDRPVRIIELGAGCALASIAAQRIVEARRWNDASMLATDVDVTVDSTLAENLAYNATSSRQPCLESAVLEWGRLDVTTKEQIIGSDDPNLTLIATDVLYNPSSHRLLLDTLLSFLRPDDSVASSTRRSRALIAYKRRTDGDDGFFEMARTDGLDVDKVWEWGEVSVWSFV